MGHRIRCKIEQIFVNVSGFHFGDSWVSKVFQRGGSAHTPNLLFGKDPGNLRDARNSLSPVVNHRVLDECTNVRWLGLYIVSLVAYMCIL